MRTEKNGTNTNNIEKKNSNTVEKETLQCDKIKSKRDWIFLIQLTIMLHEMEYKSWQQKTCNWSYEEEILEPVKIFKLSLETALRTSSNCPLSRPRRRSSSQWHKAFQMKRRRSREWQRFRISLAFEHRFVIKRENIMCQWFI